MYIIFVGKAMLQMRSLLQCVLAAKVELMA